MLVSLSHIPEIAPLDPVESVKVGVAASRTKAYAWAGRLLFAVAYHLPLLTYISCAVGIGCVIIALASDPEMAADLSRRAVCSLPN